jgi:hypothetical protein
MQWSMRSLHIISSLYPTHVRGNYVETWESWESSGYVYKMPSQIMTMSPTCYCAFLKTNRSLIGIPTKYYIPLSAYRSLPEFWTHFSYLICVKMMIKSRNSLRRQILRIRHDIQYNPSEALPIFYAIRHSMNTTPTRT